MILTTIIIIIITTITITITTTAITTATMTILQETEAAVTTGQHALQAAPRMTDTTTTDTAITADMMNLIITTARKAPEADTKDKQ